MTHNETGRDRGDGATRKALLKEICSDFPGNGVAVQRSRLLAAMRLVGYITTTEARLHLEIMNPSQRVTELRDHGENIERAWTMEPSEAGRNLHRQARYVLSPQQRTNNHPCAPSGLPPNRDLFGDLPVASNMDRPEAR